MMRVEDKSARLAGYSFMLPPSALLCCHLGPSQKDANLPSGSEGPLAVCFVYSEVTDG